MLTIEMLRQNTALSGLTDDQLSAIATMSRNDENTVIGTKVGELHGQYDSDIFNISGIKKADGEKSYEYAKRVLGKYKTDLEASKGLQAKLDEANAKVSELNEKIAKGAGDETIRQQLKDAKAQVTQLQTEMASKETAYQADKAKYEAQIKDVQVDFAFNAATSGLTFKAAIPESVQKTLLAAAKAEILAKGTPDFIDDNKGGKTLVFRDGAGNILNNAKNNLNPYTMSELVMETSLKDVIDLGKRQPGGGTHEPGGRQSGGNGLVDLTGARTQLEADKVIETYLLQQGITRDSAEFAEQSLQIRSDNNVSELPIR